MSLFVECISFSIFYTLAAIYPCRWFSLFCSSSFLMIHIYGFHEMFNLHLFSFFHFHFLFNSWWPLRRSILCKISINQHSHYHSIVHICCRWTFLLPAMHSYARSHMWTRKRVDCIWQVFVQAMSQEKDAERKKKRATSASWKLNSAKLDANVRNMSARTHDVEKNTTMPSAAMNRCSIEWTKCIK